MRTKSGQTQLLLKGRVKMDKHELGKELLKFIENNMEHIFYDDLETFNEVWTRIHNCIPED